MTSLYLKIAAGVIVAFLAGFGGYRMGASHWEHKYDALVAENWKGTAQSERTARKSVEKQLADVREQLHTNEAQLDDLHEKQAAVVADRDRTRALADRLLHRSCPNRAAVPAASDQPGANAAAQQREDDRLRELLVDARAECLGTANTLEALQNELRPQL